MRKFVVIGVIFVLVGIIFAPAISSSTIDDLEIYYPNEKELYQPKLEVLIAGVGEVIISNVGDEPAIDIECEIWFDGGLVILGDKSIKIDGELLPEESTSIRLGLVLGFGFVTMNACATASNVDETVCDELSIFILGTFIFVR
jgi:hypothetical protein